MRPNKAQPVPKRSAGNAGQVFDLVGARAFPILGAVAAGVVITFFFCPRFVLWQGLDYQFAWSYPEVNRAVDTWKKVEAPFAWINNPTNKAINWRLLFPIIAHLFHFPRTLFMSLSQIGCLVTLAVVCGLLARETGSRRTALYTTVTIGSGSWFFTSMGWLAYFDSWYILGLVLVSFSRSYWIVAAACVVTPWIDERFILALPVGLVVRAVFLDWLERRDWRSFWISSILISGLAGPYVLVRLAAIYWQWDPAAGDLLTGHLANEIAWSRYLRGAWHGLRFGWGFVGVLLWYLWSRPRWTLAALVTLVLLVDLAFSLRIAGGDLSRTTAALVPAAVMGAILWHRRAPARFARIAPWVAVLGLLAPAEHTIGTFAVPIRYLYTELDNNRNPPLFLSAAFYHQRGTSLVQQAQANPNAPNYQQALAVATGEFGTALRLDPQFVPARIARAMVRLKQNRIHDVLEDVSAVLRQSPDNVDALYLRGICLQTMAKLPQALKDFTLALNTAPAGWGNRDDAAQRQREIQRTLLTPSGGN